MVESSNSFAGCLANFLELIPLEILDLCCFPFLNELVVLLEHIFGFILMVFSVDLEHFSPAFPENTVNFSRAVGVRSDWLSLWSLLSSLECCEWLSGFGAKVIVSMLGTMLLVFEDYIFASNLFCQSQGCTSATQARCSK